MLWNDQYAPANLDVFCGNVEAVEECRRWGMEAQRERHLKPLLIHGPVGVGKTALVHALAKEMNWQLVESNAADVRDGESLEKLYSASSASAGLYGKPVLFIDEVDAVSDRKEFPVLEKLIKESEQPVILIANDVWNPKLASLRFACRLVQFKRINVATLRKRLKDIAAAEGVAEETAEWIAAIASGDLRAAINDLQALSKLTGEDLKPYEAGLSEGDSALSKLSGRDREEDLFNAVRSVLKTRTYAHALQAGDSFNSVEFDLFLRWLEHNVPLEYEKPHEIAAAFHWLSRADIFQGRIRRRQHWGYLRYVRPLALAGVAISKDETYRKFVKYEFPAVIKEMGRTRAIREARRNATRKAAGKFHVSMQDASDALAVLSGLPGLVDYLELTEAEAEPYGGLAAPVKKTRKKKAMVEDG